MIEEAKQTDNTQNSLNEVTEEIASHATADGMELQAESELTSPVAVEEPLGAIEVEIDADASEWEEMEATLTALEQENQGLKAQIDERNTQYMRIAADFDNFRKRTSKEKEDLELQVKCATLGELLSVVDNFERARSQIKPQTDAEMTIHKSYQSVYKQLVDALKRLGVSPMRPKGKEFDPNLHDAVMREPTDEYPEGTVTEELMPGYYLGERVLRHAMVKVAAPLEAVIPSESDRLQTPEG